MKFTIKPQESRQCGIGLRTGNETELNLEINSYIFSQLILMTVTRQFKGGKVFPTNGAEATRHPRYVSVSKTTTPRFSDSLEGLKGLNVFSCTLGPDLLQQKDTKSVKGKYMGVNSGGNQSQMAKVPSPRMA